MQLHIDLARDDMAREEIEEAIAILVFYRDTFMPEVYVDGEEAEQIREAADTIGSISPPVPPALVAQVDKQVPEAPASAVPTDAEIREAMQGKDIVTMRSILSDLGATRPSDLTDEGRIMFVERLNG
jgi:hypothetical protein